MASCLIITTGTSGTVALNYKLGLNNITTYFSYGDIIYIDDTATNITYTTLSGDMGLSSGCVSITNLPISYYKITYDGADICQNYFNFFSELNVNNTPYAIPNSPLIKNDLASFPMLADFINVTLNSNEVKLTSAKMDLQSTTDYEVSFVLQVIGAVAPYLQLTTTRGNFIYLHGILVGSSVPPGYTGYNFCSQNPPL